jgi:hypothetical protein
MDLKNYQLINGAHKIKKEDLIKNIKCMDENEYLDFSEYVEGYFLEMRAREEMLKFKDLFQETKDLNFLRNAIEQYFILNNCYNTLIEKRDNYLYVTFSNELNISLSYSCRDWNSFISKSR